MKASLFTVLLAVCVLLGSCSTADRKILDDMGLIVAMGYDEISDDKVVVSCVLPNTTPQGKVAPEILSVVARSGKDARQKLNSLSGKRIEAGQLKVLLFGEKTARHSIRKYIEAIYRDPAIGSMMFVAIVKGKAIDALQVDTKVKKGTGLYLYNMLLQEEKIRGANLARLINVMRDMESDGRNPIIPYLIVQKQGILFNGLALCNDSKMSGQIPLHYLPIFSFLRGVNYQDTIHFILDRKTKTTIAFVRNHRHLDISYDPKIDRVHIDIHVKVKGQIVEYTGEGINKKEELDILQERLANQIKQKGGGILSMMQKQGADGLGLGGHVKSRNVYPKFDGTWWQKQYRKADINVKVDVILTRAGLLR